MGFINYMQILKVDNWSNKISYLAMICWYEIKVRMFLLNYVS